jgi:hypothetical protein
MANETASASMRVKCVAILTVFALLPNIQLNKTIGDAFMDVLARPTTPIDVATEILNGIFDIYADEDFVYDIPVFKNGNYLGKLKALNSTLKSKIKSLDKRKQRDVRERGDAALINLRAFLDYKEREYKKRNC